jgi:hypothetical protein
MSNRFRIAVLGAGAAGLLALGLASGTAHASVAGDYPTPTPTYTTQPPVPTPTCVTRDGGPVSLTAFHGNPTPTPTETVYPPRPEPRAQCADWTFDLQLSDIDGIHVNDVRGRGAIGFNRWIDVQLSNNVDKFRSVGGGNSVTLWHEGLDASDAQLSVDRYTCTVDIQQLDARFFILNGQGIGRGWRVVDNTGRFNLEGQLSWDLVSKKSYDNRDQRHNLQVCPLARVSDRDILRALLSSNGGGLPAPATDDFSVQGRALLVRGGAPIPHPFAPTATPSVTA